MLHLPAGHANIHEEEMAFVSAFYATSQVAGEPVLLWFGASLLGQLHTCMLLTLSTKRLTGWSLACCLQNHFRLAIMAAHFSMSVLRLSKIVIFGG